jgi:hypothetical protein
MPAIANVAINTVFFAADLSVTIQSFFTVNFSLKPNLAELSSH